MRRLLAAASLAALGLSLTVPVAMAHDEQYVHTMAWGADPNPTTAKNGSQVFANDEVVAASAKFVDGVKSWDVVIRPAGGGQPSTCHEDLAQKDGKYPEQVYINCPWDTTRATNHTLPGYTAEADASNPKFQRTWQSQDLGPSVNGKYTVEITAYNSGAPYHCVLGCSKPIPTAPHFLYESGSNPARWRELWVVNEVSEPTGVADSYNPANNRITVSWAPNPEPDVSYVVQEKVGDGTFKKIADVPGNATTYDRVIEQPGKYQYRVGAVRPAPTPDSGSATKKSPFVAASAIDIDQVTPPTTAGANGADGTVDGGGDPGVNMPGDTPATTAPGAPRASGPGKGSTTAGRSGVGAVGARPSGTSARPTGSSVPSRGEDEGEGPDEGFSTALPYTQDGAAEDGLGAGDEEIDSLSNVVTVPRPHDTRALLIPLAGGLAMFVFAMQVTVTMRRRPAMAVAEDDFAEWMGL